MTISAMRLAAIHYQTGFPIDDFLARVGAHLRADDIRVGGAIQLNVAAPAQTCGAMTLVDLSSGTAMEISQQLGALAQGCRLDTGRLAEFGALLERPADDGVELLILNKFGRAEAGGHGLRRNIAHALDAGVAVLTAVRPPYDEAWREFHGGLATDLPPDLARVQAWCHAAVAQCRLGETPAVPLPTSESA